MIYRVKEPFSYTDDNGVPRVMRVGDLVTASHDAYRVKWSHLFEPVEAAVEAAAEVSPVGVEAATADPGEKRSLSTTLPPKPEPVDDLDALRKQATDAGVKVDNRWGADRLRQEIEGAAKKSSGD